MKKLIFTLFVVFGVSMVSMAQEADVTATTKGKTELLADKEKGVFVFTLPARITQEDVEKSAKYYEHYFAVAYDAGKHVATITMIENDDRSRAIVMRFLAANSIKTVTVDGTNLSIEEFRNQYLY